MLQRLLRKQHQHKPQPQCTKLAPILPLKIAHHILKRLEAARPVRLKTKQAHHQQVEAPAHIKPITQVLDSHPRSKREAILTPVTVRVLSI